MNFEAGESCDVDDGSLKGLTETRCFILGVEWELFRARLTTGRGFTQLCHHENRARLMAMAERQGRFCEDRSEPYNWGAIWVGRAVDPSSKSQ